MTLMVASLGCVAAYLVVEDNMSATPIPPPPPVPTAPSKQSLSPDPSRVTDSWLWIRDSKGYGSVTVTFVTIAFFVTTLAYVLSIVEKIGPVVVRPFDVAACSAYFIPMLTLYFGRKWTEAKHNNKESE